jgi:hypothetical protein
MIAERVKPIHADPNRAKSLLRGLDASDFKTRQEALAELFRLGRVAEPALKAALASKPSEEVRARIEELLKAAQSPYPASAEAWQQAWAVRALEWAGTQEARKILDSLAAGSPGIFLTEQAAEALRRLKAAPPAQPAGKTGDGSEPPRPQK